MFVREWVRSEIMGRHVHAGNTCLWKRDFGPEAALCAVRVDPSDARRLCLCGQKGSLIVLRLTNMARDRVEQQTYKVDMSASKPGDALRAVFSTTRDLLYVLLPREVSPKLCPMHETAKAHHSAESGMRPTERRAAALQRDRTKIDAWSWP